MSTTLDFLDMKLLAITITLLGLGFQTSVYSWAPLRNKFIVYPACKSLTPDACILLEGHGVDRSMLEKLNQDHMIYLESENHRVGLMLKGMFEGLFNTTQALLKPVDQLHLGATYYLKVEHRGKGETEQIRKWNASTQIHEKICWTINDCKHKNRQSPTTDVKLGDAVLTWQGSGATVYAQFDVKIDSLESPYLMVELFDLNSNQRNKYILMNPGKESLRVGHEALHGPFIFKGKHYYEMRLRPLNKHGEANSNWSQWISFDNPLNLMYPKPQNGRPDKVLN